MNRIFLYELRRQAVNKFFAGVLAACLLFAWMALRTSVIRGIANTAPFSAWSFGYYMAGILPLLIVALFFSLRNVYSSAARRLEALTSATPADERIYRLIKYGAALTSWSVILFSTILLGLSFLTVIFGDALAVGEIILSCVAVTLPALLFFFGAGMLAGRLVKWQSFVVAAIAVAVSVLPVNGYAVLFGTDFFSQYPLTLDNPDPAFSLPLSLIAWKTLFTAAGVALAGTSKRLGDILAPRDYFSIRSGRRCIRK